MAFAVSLSQLLRLPEDVVTQGPFLIVLCHRVTLQGSIDMEEAVRIESNQEWAGEEKYKHTNVFTIEVGRCHTHIIMWAGQVRPHLLSLCAIQGKYAQVG
jgi:hypothetical protein